MKTRNRLFQMILAVACLFVALPAAAQPLREGVQYTVVSRMGDVIRVKIAERVNINTPEFAKAFGTTPEDIRSDNPTHTLALCKRVGDGYHWALHPKSNAIADIIAARASNAIWTTCPENLRYTYIVPGETLTLTQVHHLTFGEKQAILTDLESPACQGDASCVNKNLAKLGVKVQSGTAHAASPQTNAPAETSSKPSPAPVVQSPAVRPSAQTNSGRLNVTILAFICILLLGGVVYLFARDRSFQRERDNIVTLRAQIDELDEERGNLSRKFGQAQAENVQHAKLVSQLQGAIASLTSEKESAEKAYGSAVATAHHHAKECGVAYGQTTTVGEVLQRIRGKNDAALATETREKEEVLNNLGSVKRVLTDRDRELTEVRNHLEAAQAEIARLQADKSLYAELVQQKTANDRRLLEIEAELEQVGDDYQGKRAAYDAEQADPMVPLTVSRSEIERLEQRLHVLNTERSELSERIPIARKALQDCHLRLTGMAATEEVLYAEAQLARDEAEKIRAEAVAQRSVAHDLRAYVERGREQLNADRDANKAERAELDVVKASINDQQAAIGEQQAVIKREGAQVHRLLEDTLEAIGMPRDLPLEGVEKLGGPSGLIFLAGEKLKEGEKEIKRLSTDLNLLNQDHQHLAQGHQTLQQDMKALKGDRSVLMETIDIKDEKLAALERQKDELKQRNAGLEKLLQQDASVDEDVEVVIPRDSVIPPDIADLADQEAGVPPRSISEVKRVNGTALHDEAPTQPLQELWKGIRSASEVPVDVMLKVASREDFWALHGFLFRRVEFDVQAICEDEEGNLSVEIAEMLKLQKVTTRLGRSTIVDVEWFAQTLSPQYRPVTNRTLVPTGLRG